MLLNNTTSPAAARSLMLLVLGGAIALVGLIATLAHLNNVSDARRLLARGVSANGTVTYLSTKSAITAPRAGRVESARNFVMARFTDQAGSEHSAGTDTYVGAGEMANLSVGGPVPLVYEPSAPERIYVKAALERLVGASWLIWLTGAATVFGLLMVASGVALLKRGGGAG